MTVYFVNSTVFHLNMETHDSLKKSSMASYTVVIHACTSKQLGLIKSIDTGIDTGVWLCYYLETIFGGITQPYSLIFLFLHCGLLTATELFFMFFLFASLLNCSSFVLLQSGATLPRRGRFTVEPCCPRKQNVFCMCSNCHPFKPHCSG